MTMFFLQLRKEHKIICIKITKINKNNKLHHKHCFNAPHLTLIFAGNFTQEYFALSELFPPLSVL